jgi:hypothetical protein
MPVPGESNKEEDEGNRHRRKYLSSDSSDSGMRRYPNEPQIGQKAHQIYDGGQGSEPGTNKGASHEPKEHPYFPSLISLTQD